MAKLTNKEVTALRARLVKRFGVKREDAIQDSLAAVVVAKAVRDSFSWCVGYVEHQTNAGAKRKRQESLGTAGDAAELGHAGGLRGAKTRHRAQPIPRGYSQLPSGHVVGGRFVPGAPGEQPVEHDDGTRTMPGRIELPADPGLEPVRLTEADHVALSLLLCELPFGVKADGDGYNLDSADQASRCMVDALRRAACAALGLKDVRQAPYWADARSAVWTLTRLALAQLGPEPPDKQETERALDALPGWLSRADLDGLLLGNAGGQGKTERTIRAAVREALNRALEAAGLPILSRKTLRTRI